MSDEIDLKVKKAPVKKSELLGRYIKFYDNNHALRICQVIRVRGNTITVEDAVKCRYRLHPQTNLILGVVDVENGELRDIEFGDYKTGSKLRNRIRKTEYERETLRALGRKRRVFK